jgi:hypothetical protein
MREKMIGATVATALEATGLIGLLPPTVVRCTLAKGRPLPSYDGPCVSW